MPTKLHTPPKPKPEKPPVPATAPLPTQQLENENLELKALATELTAINLALHKKLARIEAKYIDAKNELAAIKEMKDPHGDIEQGNKLRALDEKQLQSEINNIQGKLSKS